MESITYNIRIVDTSGCIMNDKQEIWGFPKNDVFLPRAFIPNNPVMTENKILKPVYVGIKELKSFRVFDRFGHIIFSTNNMAHFWDGTTNNGKLSPTETYSWIIVAIDTQGKQIIKKGNVTLIRN
jgi:gliding motility-associated-like protein